MSTTAAVLLESSDISVRGAGLGLLGGLVFTLIVISTILLVRNMNQRIKRLPDEFEPPADGVAGSGRPNSE